MWTPIIIGVLLIIGSAIHHFSHTNDSVPEEIVEQMLKAEGVNIDFSAYDKAHPKAIEDEAKKSEQRVD